MQRTAKIIATELLVLQAKSGDKAAFEELYRLWMPIVYGRCLRQLKHTANAQDATSKTWIKIIKGIGRLKNPTTFAAWLMRIAHLTCVDIVRKQIRQGSINQQLQDEIPNQTAIDENAIDLSTAIKQLPEGQQQVLDLHYSLGFSVAQIAHILGIKTGTVKSRLHTARQFLKTKLQTGENYE
ncbi:MAG: RNA polymerase sigma factor [Robiginitomaculum sp.]|nr:RNA polymerase sigma factor [Robiginitomaculum sp.]